MAKNLWYKIGGIVGVSAFLILVGCGIGGCYNSNMKRQRDQYRAENKNLNQQLQLSEEQNALVVQRANQLEKALETANNRNTLYQGVLEKGANSAEQYGRGLIGYAATLRNASKKISISQ